MFRKRRRNTRVFKRMAMFEGVRVWVLGEDGVEDEGWAQRRDVIAGLLSVAHCLKGLVCYDDEICNYGGGKAICNA